jgi:sensor domain CHASE-containing protein
MIQLILAGFQSGRNDDWVFGGSKVLEVGYWVFVLALPLVSIPALIAAFAGIKARQYRAWNVAGAVLNSAYILLFLLMCALLIVIVAHLKR